MIIVIDSESFRAVLALGFQHSPVGLCHWRDFGFVQLIRSQILSGLRGEELHQQHAGVYEYGSLSLIPMGLELSFVVVVGVRGCTIMRDLICFAMVRKIVSTLVLVLADVSKKPIPMESANSFPCSVGTTRLSGRSALFPTNIMSTSFLACRLISRSHIFTLEKDVSSVTSYATIMPWAPR